MEGLHTTKCVGPSINEFTLLKKFKVQIHSPEAQVVREVLWGLPQSRWIKVNVDGASEGTPLLVAYCGIFKNDKSDRLSSFACNMDPKNVLFVELMGAILVMEYDIIHNLDKLWIATNSI